MFDNLKSLKKGDDYIEDGFMSTSANKLVADDFADGAQYKIIFEIEGKNGVDISYISDMQEEKEILFDKSSKFKITKIKVVDKKIFGIYISIWRKYKMLYFAKSNNFLTFIYK